VINYPDKKIVVEDLNASDFMIALDNNIQTYVKGRIGIKDIYLHVRNHNHNTRTLRIAVLQESRNAYLAIPEPALFINHQAKLRWVDVLNTKFA
jgi:hypothetical protein